MVRPSEETRTSSGDCALLIRRLKDQERPLLPYIIADRVSKYQVERVIALSIPDKGARALPIGNPNTIANIFAANEASDSNEINLKPARLSLI